MSSPYSKIQVTCQTHATASDLPNLQYLCPAKVPLSKNFDDVIACDLGPPQSKILATPMRYSPILKYYSHRCSCTKFLSIYISLLRADMDL